MAVAIEGPELTHQSAAIWGLWSLNLLANWLLFAVAVRRLHDFDSSGWILLWWIVPVVGLIVLVWLFGRSGSPGQNRFGSPEPFGGAAT